MLPFCQFFTFRERAPLAQRLVAEPPALAPDHVHRAGDRDVTDALAAPGVHPDRDHPTGWAPRRVEVERLTASTEALHNYRRARKRSVASDLSVFPLRETTILRSSL